MAGRLRCARARVLPALLGALALTAGASALGRNLNASQLPPAGAPGAPVVAQAPALGGPVVTAVAAGDIACDPAAPDFHGGQGSATVCHQAATADLIAALHPDAVLALGDNQYEDGALAKFMASYDATWGRFRAITRPIVGNHEYLTPDAAGYFAYFGAAAGDPDKGYYSYDLGAWHVVALNSECSHVGGCGRGSPQERWLRADLAAHPSRCTLAYWHEPRYASGPEWDNANTTALWQALYDNGAELVLSGHAHDYERFAPQDAHWNLDPARGVVQLVVGTGGANHTPIGYVRPNSLVHDDVAFGVLLLTLEPDGYTWRFVPEPGQTFIDGGSARCH